MGRTLSGSGHALFVVAAAMLAVAILAVPRARAHGRDAALNAVLFHPFDRDRIVARATWGFLSSRDGGSTWSWQCAAAVPFDPSGEDPALVMTDRGALIAGTAEGLVRSDEEACTFHAVSGSPFGFISDVVRDPASPSRHWALHSPGFGTPDGLYRSDDDGVSWSRFSVTTADTLSDRVRIAPSDPARIYASGLRLGPDNAPMIGIVLRSIDRGASFEPPIEVPFLREERTAERSVHLLAIDPLDPGRLLARTVRRVTDNEHPERVLLSEDAGATWRSVFEMLEIVGAAVSDDGAQVWVGSWDGGLARSDDRGTTFRVLDPDLRVRCLAFRPPSGDQPAELWACVDPLLDGRGLLRSRDGGETFETIWRREDLVSDLGCPSGSGVADLCPPWLADVRADLGLPPIAEDGGLADAGAGSLPPSGGCTCSAARCSHGLLEHSMALALGIAVLRRRLRRV